MRAALYLRSSKDRADVSLDAQRRELQALALARGFEIATEFADAVESGSTDDRPGFRQLVDALKNAQRGWTALLVYDTSRLARRRYIAQALKHEARKRGVAIHYAKIPQDLDPIAEVVLESVFEAMDEVHSLLSREKGLAGMRENVRQGWRAGGMACMGYRLEHVATGAIREGKPVTKSRLVLGPDAPLVKRYLQGRALGRPRTALMRELGMARSPSTMIHVEWNALTYAGHTTWNVHVAESTRLRKPREEWLVQRDTHPALITDAEAESILSQRFNSDAGKAVSAGKGAVGKSLLGGVLVAPDGTPWRVQGAHYRLRKAPGRRGKIVKAAAVDEAVVSQLRADLANLGFWKRLLEASKAMKTSAPDVSQEVARLGKERDRAARLAASTDDPGPFLEIVRQRTTEMAALRREGEARQQEQGLSALVARTTPAELAEMVLASPEKAVATIVARVVLTPGLDCRVEYRAPGWRSMALPGRVDRSPPVAVSRVRLALQ